MRVGLVFKLALASSLGMAVVVTAYGALAISREARLFEDIRRETSFGMNRNPYMEASAARLGVALGVCVLTNAAVAFVLSSYLVGRPVGKLMAKVRQVSEGTLQQPIDLRTGDEFGLLARELDLMADKLRSTRDRLQEEESARRALEEGLRHSERLATIGKLSAGLAHELGTPLNVVIGRAKRLARQVGSEGEVGQNAAIIAEQSERIAHIVRQLLDFGRRRPSTRVPSDLEGLARHALAVLEPVLSRNRVTFQFQCDAPTIALVEPTQFQQVLTNLVTNAMDAMPGGGEVKIRVAVGSAIPPTGSTLKAGDFVILTVQDAGVGIAPENLPRIFEPFFTTKEVGRGTGLGLSVAHGIVQEHGGWIVAASQPGSGSTFTVYLPRGSA